MKGAIAMTMIELQDVLADVLRDVVDKTKTGAEHKKAVEVAEYTAKISKQMINNADIILRTDKLGNRHDRIDKVVGDGNC
jgi:hypothetical protein